MTAVERLSLLRSGRSAYRVGMPSTACPYDLHGSREESARGACWLRGFVLTRRVAEG
jgi:hypothetical protein